MAYSYADADEPVYDGHPIVALAILVILILARLGAPIHWREEGAVPAQLVGEFIGSIVFGIILWGIAYAITIKRASPAWRIGSLITVIILSLLVSLAELGRPGVAMAHEQDRVRDQLSGVLAAKGDIDKINVKTREGDGPLSRMNAVILNGMIADRRDYQREAAAAGLDGFDLGKVAKSSPILSKCATMAAMPARAVYYKGRFETHVAAGRAIGDAAVASGELPTAAVRGFAEGARSGALKVGRNWDIAASLAEESAAVCTLLKKKSWSRKGENFVFAAQSDANAFNAHLARINAYVSEAQRADNEARTRADEFVRTGNTPRS